MEAVKNSDCSGSVSSIISNLAVTLVCDGLKVYDLETPLKSSLAVNIKTV